VCAMLPCTWGSWPTPFVRDASVNDRLRYQNGTKTHLIFMRPEIVVLRKLYDLSGDAAEVPLAWRRMVSQIIPNAVIDTIL